MGIYLIMETVRANEGRKDFFAGGSRFCHAMTCEPWQVQAALISLVKGLKESMELKSYLKAFLATDLTLIYQAIDVDTLKIVYDMSMHVPSGVTDEPLYDPDVMPDPCKHVKGALTSLLEAREIEESLAEEGVSNAIHPRVPRL